VPVLVSRCDLHGQCSIALTLKFAFHVSGAKLGAI
jgi:hypothetical protein